MESSCQAPKVLSTLGFANRVADDRVPETGFESPSRFEPKALRTAE
jgi:hypothetical protein